MIDFIKGYIEHTGLDYIVVSCHDIGYKIMTSQTSMTTINQKNDKVTLFTELIVREDSMTLCGFSTAEEKEMFKLLTSVSGVGTKVALAILSSIPYSHLYQILIAGDINALMTANGVGKKTAQRMILELKDKVTKLEIQHLNELDGSAGTSYLKTKDMDEAYEALKSLGYQNNEISKAMELIEDKNVSVETLIKNALKHLMKA
jgi:Holliday junction DNA helicase RuvA